MNVFETNAAELEKLRQRVLDLSRKRRESPKHEAAWHEAARIFHEAYDTLAFPGGLSREFELLRIGDAAAIEMAVQFLEANPWYFRSGYYKADILRLLRKHPLNEDQGARMRKLILERVQGLPVREIRAFARFTPKVTTPEFEAEIVNIAENANRQVARHAQWVLDCLKSDGKIPRQA
ncbi:MAG TPA: hypothetical protein VKH81_04170 [Candidatus Angelobacter sp.]|nr:hypothetical protein [Candidatus Angelobacter sp.]